MKSIGLTSTLLDLGMRPRTLKSLFQQPASAVFMIKPT
jgi:hypothetical protein